MERVAYGEGERTGMTDYIDRQAAIDFLKKWIAYDDDGCQTLEVNPDTIFHGIEAIPSAEVEPVVHCIDCITDETAQKIIEEAKSLELRHCNKLGWAYCNGNCDECSTTVTTMTTSAQYPEKRSKMICQFCEHTDGCEYTSIPPQIKCTITNKFHYYNDECDIEWTPVKHGRWITDNNKQTKCSICGRPIPLRKVRHNGEVIWEDNSPVNYCPRCGAKMEPKGEEKE